MTKGYNKLLEETVKLFVNNCINKQGESCQNLTAKLKQKAELIFEDKKADNLTESRAKCERVFQELRDKHFTSDADETWFDKLKKEYSAYPEELGPAKDEVFEEVFYNEKKKNIFQN